MQVFQIYLDISEFFFIFLYIMVYVIVEFDWMLVLINFDEMCVCLFVVDVRGGEVK